MHAKQVFFLDTYEWNKKGVNSSSVTYSDLWSSLLIASFKAVVSDGPVICISHLCCTPQA